MCVANRLDGKFKEFNEEHMMCSRVHLKSSCCSSFNCVGVGTSFYIDVAFMYQRFRLHTM
jgi:hypothetical protein